MAYRMKNMVNVQHQVAVVDDIDFITDWVETPGKGNRAISAFSAFKRRELEFAI